MKTTFGPPTIAIFFAFLSATSIARADASTATGEVVSVSAASQRMNWTGFLRVAPTNADTQVTALFIYEDQAGKKSYELHVDEIVLMTKIRELAEQRAKVILRGSMRPSTNVIDVLECRELDKKMKHFERDRGLPI